MSFSLALTLNCELVAIAKTTPELKIYVFNYLLGQAEPTMVHMNVKIKVSASFSIAIAVRLIQMQDTNILQLEFCNNDLFLISEISRKTYIYHCPALSLPYNTTQPLSSIKFDDRPQIHEWPTVEGAENSEIEHGLDSQYFFRPRPSLLISMTDLQVPHLDFEALEFRFYKLDEVSGGETITSAHSLIVQGHTVDGARIGMHQIGFSLLHSSHLCLMFFVDSEKTPRLLTFDPAGTKTTLGVMEFPESDVDLNEVVSITLDSYIGMVVAVTKSGRIISIPYA